MRVTCPSCETTYRVANDVKPGSTITCKECGTRIKLAAPTTPTAPPPAHRPAHAKHGETTHARRPSRDNSSALAFGMLVAVAAAALAVVLFLVARPRPPSFEEFKAQLGIPANAVQIDVELDESQFMARIGDGWTRADGDKFIYFTCPVKEGKAQVALDRTAWEGGKARIRGIACQ